MLSGSFDTITMTDILDLLASSRKTGSLVLDGVRGGARIELHAGGLVGVEPTGAGLPSPVDADAEPGALLVEVCTLLGREATGRFQFTPSSEVSPAPPTTPLDDLRSEIAAHLSRWEAVISELGSLDVVLELAPELRDGSVLLDEHDWRIVVGCGRGAQVEPLARLVQRPLLDVATTAAELLRRGVLRVRVVAPEPPAPITRDASGVPATVPPAPVVAPGASEVVDALELVLARAQADTAAATADVETVAHALTNTVTAPAPAPAPDLDSDSDTEADGDTEAEAQADVAGSEAADRELEPAAPADRGAILRLFSALKDPT